MECVILITVNERNKEKKMNFPYKRVLIIDTETANSIEQPLPYDMGWAILDVPSQTYLSTHSYVCAEIYLDHELMQSAYYAKKIPQYEEDLASGKRTLARLSTIRKVLADEIKAFGVEAIGAYNMGFDRRALNNDQRLITSSKFRWFFPYEMEYFCIWNMACSSILRSKRFIEWAEENECISAHGNIQTSAEVAYRYLLKNTNFDEQHMGFEDVVIETEIFFAVLNSRMKYETAISPACWRIPQKRRKELAEGLE